MRRREFITLLKRRGGRVAADAWRRRRIACRATRYWVVREDTRHL